MSFESPELAALKRALGRQLAAARQAAEIGQQQVAHQTGYSRSSVAHAEAGRQLLTRDFWRTADKLVNADGALLAGYERAQAAKQEHEARSREAELAKAYAEAQAQAQALRATATSAEARNGNGLILPTGQEVLRSLVSAVGADLASDMAEPLLYLAFLSAPAQTTPTEWRDQLSEQLRTFLCEWAHTVERREHLRLLGWVATTIATSPLSKLNTDEQERLSKVMAAPSRVDEQTIGHIEAVLWHCQRQDDALGPHAALDTVLAQRNLARALARKCPSSLRPRILSVLSNASRHAGWLSFDLNDFESARYYYEDARALAHEAENVELGAFVLCNMSHLATWQRKPRVGIDHAVAAEEWAKRTDDVALRAYSADVAARAYAADGQPEACLAALDTAGITLTMTGEQQPSYVYFYDEGQHSATRCLCYLELHEPQQAVAYAEQSLKTLDRSYARNVAFATVNLGQAHMLSGEIDEAARLLGDAGEIAACNTSARLVKKLEQARVDIQPWQYTVAVRTLDQRLTSYGLV